MVPFDDVIMIIPRVFNPISDYEVGLRWLGPPDTGYTISNIAFMGNGSTIVTTAKSLRKATLKYTNESVCEG